MNVLRINNTIGCFLGTLLLSMCVLVGCSQEASTQSRSNKADEDRAAATATANATRDTRQQEIVASEKLAKAGDLDEAADILQKILIVNPEDYEVIFRLANIKAKAKAFEEAISMLDGIPATHPEAGLAALGQAAEWCERIGRYDDAEKKYLKMVSLVPDESIVRRALATLLNRQGRRHEASAHIQHLCRLGDVQQAELNSLLSLSDAVYFLSASDDIPANEKPIAPFGEARCYFTERKYDKATELLQANKSLLASTPAMNAFYGRVLAEAQEEQMFLEWLAEADASTKNYAEYWAAVGTFLVNQQRYEEAVRALGEAIRRDATDVRSSRRMNQSLIALKQDEAAKPWVDRFLLVRGMTVASKRIDDSKGSDAAAFTELIDALNQLGRPLEAVMWQWLDRYYRDESPQQMSELRQRQSALSSAKDAFGVEKTWLCGLELDNFPVPEWPELNNKEAADASIANRPLVSTPEIARFENIAGKVGFDHTYHSASQSKSRSYAIYEAIGGGVAVVDYDMDGLPDLYMAQGSADPPHFEATRSDQLFRNSGSTLRDVTLPSGMTEGRYTLGVTAGDWNQDGFPDIVIANIGANQMLINNGDGTYRRESLDTADDLTLLSTSLAMGDLTGDALPEIFEVNYIHDAAIARQPSLNAAGLPEVIAPLDFKPAMDRLHVNTLDGSPSVTAISKDTTKMATGLGVVICDFDGDPINEAFVGNDVRRDQLWKRNLEGNFVDIAPTTGCALGNEGTVTASMGIAAADFDNSGTLDLYITNYENEASTFFLNRNGVFQERGVQFKLAEPSIPVLGFGCQAIDFNNDGLNDLAVTNGHVEDTGAKGHAYRQPTQLFANRGNRFESVEVQDSSGFFGSLHVGRALARLDFNQDGQQDFVVTHLNEPSALLINRTESKNHWLKVRLVGVSCERDAVGAKVQVISDSRVQSSWVIAGDGYLARNEPTVFFGLGSSDSIDELRVTWPDGMTQSFPNVTTNQGLLIVQGESSPHSDTASGVE